MRLTAILFFAIAFFSEAQTPQVPHKIQFAGITLSIRDDARREIQKDVDMLTQSQKYFMIKVERARTYFPIIEKIFEEERVPDDMKYLVLQESALIADAVSTSNAVGFWQFKDFTAIEMGLRVDKEIDERMNIVSASRAAARYLKKNNFYFNNWLYALQAYQMGAGGVMKSVKDYESGTKHMEITSKTYWYVKKYLAHKIAFEGAVNKEGEIKALTVDNKGSKSLASIAKEFAIDETELQNYNKWVRKGSIPGDRVYTVIIPTAGTNRQLERAVAQVNQTIPKTSDKRIEPKPAEARDEKIYINGIPALRAKQGDTWSSLAARGGVNLSAFLKYNDVSITDKIAAGEPYLLRKKKNRGSMTHHTVSSGESLWQISQRYGIQLRKIKKYNEGVGSNTPTVGTVLLLQPGVKDITPAIDLPVVEVDEAATFNWGVSPESLQTSIAPIPVVLSPQETSAGLPTDTISKSEVATHIVVQGEALYGIAKRYGVGVMELVEWNQLNLADGIKPGQVLKVSDKPEISEPVTNVKQEAIIHEVKASDTLYSIARAYNVTIQQLMEWNNRSDFVLKPGEKLKILTE